MARQTLWGFRGCECEYNFCDMARTLRMGKNAFRRSALSEAVGLEAPAVRLTKTLESDDLQQEGSWMLNRLGNLLEARLSQTIPERVGWSVAVRSPVAGNGIFGCRDWWPRIHRIDRYCRQRPGTLK